MPTPSPEAREVLGVLAPFLHTGPHHAAPLRRRTRLTPHAFDRAVQELDTLGLVTVRAADELWLTRAGEAWTQALYA